MNLLATLFLLGGVGLLFLALFILLNSGGMPGDGGPDYTPAVKAGGAVIAALIAFAISRKLPK